MSKWWRVERLGKNPCASIHIASARFPALNARGSMVLYSVVRQVALPGVRSATIPLTFPIRSAKVARAQRDARRADCRAAWRSA